MLSGRSNCCRNLGMAEYDMMATSRVNTRMIVRDLGLVAIFAFGFLLMGDASV